MGVGCEHAIYMLVAIRVDIIAASIAILVQHITMIPFSILRACAQASGLRPSRKMLVCSRIRDLVRSTARAMHTCLPVA